MIKMSNFGKGIGQKKTCTGITKNKEVDKKEHRASPEVLRDSGEFEEVWEETKGYSLHWACKNKCGLCKSKDLYCLIFVVVFGFS